MASFSLASVGLRKLDGFVSYEGSQRGLYILSLIQLNVTNTHRRLPEDLIILLISNYFKDKWVHLASEQTCQCWAREAVPSSLLSAETNGLTIKPFYFLALLFHIPTRLEFKKDFLLLTAAFLSFTLMRRASCYVLRPDMLLHCSSFADDIEGGFSPCTRADIPVAQLSGAAV